MTELAGITCGHFWSENRQRISWLERKRAAYPAGKVANLHWPTCLHLIFPAAHPRPDPFVHLSALIYLDGRRQTRSFHPRPGGFIWFSFAWCRWHEKWQWMDPLSIVCPSIDPLFCFSCGGSERLVLRPIGRLCHRPKCPLTDVFIFWRQFCFWITKWRQNIRVTQSDTGATLWDLFLNLTLCGGRWNAQVAVLLIGPSAAHTHTHTDTHRPLIIISDESFRCHSVFLQ